MKGKIFSLHLFILILLVIFLVGCGKKLSIFATFQPYAQFKKSGKAYYLDENRLLIINKNQLSVLDINQEKVAIELPQLDNDIKISDAVYKNTQLITVGGECGGPTCIGKGEIHIYDLTKRKLLKTIADKSGLEQGQGHFSSVVFTQDGKFLATSQIGGVLKVWNMESNNPSLTMGNLKCEIWSLISIPKSNLVISGNAHGEIDVWDIKKGVKVKQLQKVQEIKVDGGHTSIDGSLAVLNLAYSEKHDILAAKAYNSIRVWNVNSGKKIKTFTTTNMEVVEELSFHSDKPILATSLISGSIQLIDVFSKKVMTFKAHNSSINNLQFSKDGKYLLSSGSDGHIKIWESDELINKL